MRVDDLYIIRWAEVSLKSLRKVSRSTADKIIDGVEHLKDDPFKHVKKLRDYPFYTLRVGDYRIILVIDVGNKSIVVLYVERRRKAYRKFT